MPPFFGSTDTTDHTHTPHTQQEAFVPRIIVAHEHPPEPPAALVSLQPLVQSHFPPTNNVSPLPDQYPCVGVLDAPDVLHT
jgi:hypothetical protein